MHAREEPRSESDRSRNAERRTDDRRSRENRRSGADRRPGKERSNRSIILIGLGLTAGLLLPTLVIYLLISTTGPIRRPQGRVAVIDPDRDSMFLDLSAPRPTRKAEPAPKLATRISEDILELAPDLYRGVSLGYLQTPLSLAEESPLEEETVNAATISVRSGPWDRRTSLAKVDLLKRTYRLLKRKYPQVTQRVDLRFDDGRPDLELQFGEAG